MTRATPLPPDERRQAIVAATRPLLIASGGQFTTRQVAEAAGIAEGTIFRVFENKQELLAAVIDNTLDPTEICQQIVALPTADELLDHVAALIELLQSNGVIIAAVASALHSAAPGTIGRHHQGHDLTRRRTVIHQALTTSLQPFADRLGVPLEQAAAIIRIVAMACGHPMLGEASLCDPAASARLIVHGIKHPDED